MIDPDVLKMIHPDLLTRQDVRVNRKTGFVEGKADGGYVVGLITASHNAAGEPIWKAQAGDVGSWAFGREGAVQRVLDLWNMQAKARAYGLLIAIAREAS